MILKYGSYSFPLGCCEIQVGKKELKRADDVRYATEEMWTIRGLFQTQEATNSAAIAAIKANLDALKTAFSRDGSDLILYQTNGSTKTHHELISSACIGGVQILEPPSFPEGRGVELLTMRHFTIVARGIVKINENSLPDGLKSFEETIELAPAGSRYGHIETKIGLPVKQRLRRAQTYRAVQRGSAVGLYRRPRVPNPIWPSALVSTVPLTIKGTPKKQADGTLTDWAVSWEWLFESAFVLDGEPHQWGVNYP